MLAALVLVAAGVAGAVIANALNTTSNATTTSESTPPGAACNVTAVADRKLPSVVTILVGGEGAGGVGSGEIIRSGGYILTNNHVIAAAAAGGKVQALFDDGSTATA